jgi:hypothetical protein
MQGSDTFFAVTSVDWPIAMRMNYKPWDMGEAGRDRVKETSRCTRTSEANWQRFKNADVRSPSMRVNMVDLVFQECTVSTAELFVPGYVGMNCTSLSWTTAPPQSRVSSEQLRAGWNKSTFLIA